MQKFFLYFRSLLFYVTSFTWLLTASLVCLPLLVLPEKIVRKVTKFWAYGCILLLKFFCNIDYRILGKGNLPDNTGFVIASKHQSAWETVMFCWLLERPVFILKSELKYSLLTLSLYAQKFGFIFINRSRGAKQLKQATKRAFEELAGGKQLVIFPEGTRVSIGKKVKYKSGIAAIYKESGFQVVPVALNSGLFWPKNTLLKQPGTITLKFLPAIKSGLDRQKFMHKLQMVIDDESRKLTSV